MTPNNLLTRSATHLDDAIENLTFDRFDWAIEDAWRGVFGALAAAATEPTSLPTLPPLGTLPAPGSLLEALLLAPTGLRDSLGSMIVRFEALRRTLDDTDLSASTSLHADKISALVFDSWTVHSVCADACNAVDPRRVGSPVTSHITAPSVSAANQRTTSANRNSLHDANAAPVGTKLSRRAALQAIAAGSLLSVAACARPSRAMQDATSGAAGSATASIPETLAVVGPVTPLDGMQWPTADPFLFCAYHVDHYPAGNAQLGPDASLAGRQLGRDFADDQDWRMYHGEVIPGFPRHPHRGFETVTVVRSGLLDHADSMGAAARYGGGDVQWLTSGAGIQHAEMFPLLNDDVDNPFELFQIWMNLPASDKMVDPHFTMLWREDIPTVRLQDDAGRTTELTISAGSWGEHRPPAPPPNSWAARADSDVAIISLRMEPGAQIVLPPAQEATVRSLYVHRGNGVTVNGDAIANANRVEFAGAGAILVEAGDTEAELLLLQGRPIGEPVARRGPFVMNAPEEIEQAYADYRSTGFGGWPWQSNDPVHGTDPLRFARHIDGRYEEPT